MTVRRNLAGESPALNNAWYVVAFSDEVTQAPLARQILGKRRVLYRGDDGLAVMLDDYCPHRAMALSLGKVVGGNRIQCPYHGFEYGPDGLCAHVPSQASTPRALQTRSFPLIEKWQWIWAWMGNPADADETLIPDHSLFGLDGSEGWWTIQRFVMNIEGHYQLLHENLLDLSHVSFLHEGSFDAGGMAALTPSVDITDNMISVSRTIVERMEGPFAKIFDLPDGTEMERTLVTRAWAPNLNVVSNIFRSHHNDGATAMIRHAPFAITPETDTSCHYFVAMASNYGPDPTPQWLERSNKMVHDIFLTDKAAIESIQHAYIVLGNTVPDTSVRTDEAAVSFRRMIAAMAQKEAETA